MFWFEFVYFYTRDASEYDKYCKLLINNCVYVFVCVCVCVCGGGGGGG